MVLMGSDSQSALASDAERAPSNKRLEREKLIKNGIGYKGSEKDLLKSSLEGKRYRDAGEVNRFDRRQVATGSTQNAFLSPIAA